MRIAPIAVLAVSLFFSGSALAQLGQNERIADANLADIDALQALPPIDADLAKAIDSGRPYLTAQQFDEVLSGRLDDAEREDVYRHVFRQINLNDASRATIMLIPDMSGRMAHEFEEYRPYKSMEQFRREIGPLADSGNGGHTVATAVPGSGPGPVVG